MRSLTKTNKKGKLVQDRQKEAKVLNDHLTLSNTKIGQMINVS